MVYYHVIFLFHIFFFALESDGTLALFPDYLCYCFASLTPSCLIPMRKINTSVHIPDWCLLWLALERAICIILEATPT